MCADANAAKEEEQTEKEATFSSELRLNNYDVPSRGVCAITSLKVLFKVNLSFSPCCCGTVHCKAHLLIQINFTYVKFKRHVSNNFSGVTRDRMKIAWVSKSGLNKCDIFYTVFVFVA